MKTTDEAEVDIPDADEIWGVDPGASQKNPLGLCRADAQVGIEVARRDRGKKRESIFEFIQRVLDSLRGETLAHTALIPSEQGEVEYRGDKFTKEERPQAAIIAIEKPFDRSPGHVLERVLHDIERDLWQRVRQPILLEVNPMHLKMWVTDHGRPDEPEYWRRIQTNITEGKYPQALGSIASEHVIEACLLGCMALDWARVRAGQTRSLTGYIRGIEKLKALW